MSVFIVNTRDDQSRFRLRGARRIAARAAMLSVLWTCTGCGQKPPPANVEGTVRLDGSPLDNCLITFLPQLSQKEPQRHASAVTDERGHYRLRLADQREGASLGPHRVTVQDLSVSTGVRRRDHGTADLEIGRSPPTPMRRSRVPPRYSSSAQTPLRQEIRAGAQRIDFDIR